VSTWVHPRFLLGSVLLIFFVVCVVSRFFLFVFVLCLVCPILPVSPDCPFLIAPSNFSDVYSKDFQVIWLSNHLILRVCLRFYYYNWVETSAGRLLDHEGSIHPVVSVSAGRLLDHEGFIHPVVSVSALPWFIKYIYY